MSLFRPLSLNNFGMSLSKLTIVAVLPVISWMLLSMLFPSHKIATDWLMRIFFAISFPLNVFVYNKLSDAFYCAVWVVEAVDADQPVVFCVYLHVFESENKLAVCACCL
tara:strand:- start:396 stop:722 length:327 start_codon:yes stop_codon:yes gene_type:complete